MNLLDILEKVSDAILDGPLSWPKIYRRIFLLTFPISLPIWIFVYATFGLGYLLAVVVYLIFAGPIEFIKNMWNDE